jgi:phosphoribosyl 1,2-cyclic phosphodiesterase
MHRDGFEDYDLFSMLNKALKDNPALKTQYGPLLSAGKSFKKTGVFSTDSSYYEKRHDAVLKALEDLQALSDRNKT